MSDAEIEGPAIRAPLAAVRGHGKSDEVISVALIEDNRLVREGITALLNRLPDIQVISEDPGDLRLLDRRGESVAPDVVLLDIGLDVRDSLTVARELRATFPDAGVIVLDLLPAHEDVIEFIGAGVAGFIMKDATLDEVLRTIRSVAAGIDVLPQAMTATLFSEIAREAIQNGESAIDHDSVRLTVREQEVIHLIADGMSNKAIGHSLHVSVHTVKSHLRNIMEKLTLHSRLQIASYVHQTRNRDS